MFSYIEFPAKLIRSTPEREAEFNSWVSKCIFHCWWNRLCLSWYTSFLIFIGTITVFDTMISTDLASAVLCMSTQSSLDFIQQFLRVFLKICATPARQILNPSEIVNRQNCIHIYPASLGKYSLMFPWILSLSIKSWESLCNPGSCPWYLCNLGEFVTGGWLWKAGRTRAKSAKARQSPSLDLAGGSVSHDGIGSVFKWDHVSLLQ